MSDQLQPRQRLVHLDGLRGVAAISVVLYHVHNLFGLTLGFERAYLFVDVFFVLSGFVLTRAWSGAFAHNVGSWDLLKARIRRLWPMMALGSLVGASVHLALNDVYHVPLYLGLALLLIPAVAHNGPIYPLNGPQWSIFWELCANLVHVRWLRRLPPEKFLIPSLGMSLLAMLAIQVCNGNTAGPNGDLWWLAAPRVGWSYGIGMLMASAQQRLSWRPLLPWWQVVALFMLTMLALPVVPLATAAGDIIFTVVVSPLLFWLLVTSRAPVSASRWLSKLGAISFPLYAIHLPVLSACAALAIPQTEAAALGLVSSLSLAFLFSGSGDGVKRPAPSPRLLVKLPN